MDTGQIQKNFRDNEYIERRDQYIYEIVRDRFTFELNRINNIDEKASKIVGFIGIIIGLDAALGAFLLKEINENNSPFSIGMMVFLISVIFLFIAFLCSLEAYNVKEWVVVPDTNYRMCEHAQ